MPHSQIVWIASISVFALGYLLNVFYISVFYHRGLTHQAVTLGPKVEKWVAATGIWVTGIDPKAWACMHRLHHQFSDTPKDPHSPLNHGVLGVLFAQLKSYERVLKKLIMKDPQMTRVVSDLSFDVSFLNRHRLWLLPYILHLAISCGLSALFHSPLVGLAYFIGIMSHPIQGWMVNSFAHRFGYRNFETSDNSQNNLWVSFLVFGEGLQNNHHQYPARAKFSVRPAEFDPGYAFVVMAEKLGILRRAPQTLLHDLTLKNDLALEEV